jgi:hypothetical protein
MKVKKAIHRHKNQFSTFVVKYTMAPDYDQDLFFEMDGTYQMVRAYALQIATMSKDRIILDISEKEKNAKNGDNRI